MDTIGIDIGSLNTKAVLLGENGISAFSIIPTGDEASKTARQVIDEIKQKANINTDSLPVISTGIGSKQVSYISQQKTITTCLARGTHYLFPKAKMAIDMGAESTTVIKINERGRLSDWTNHDKCASGTGIFLQQMAKLMAMTLPDMANLSLTSLHPADITSTCAVFAESEVISHVHRIPPTPKEDIASGIYASVVSRIISLCKRIGIEKEIAVTGGVALNIGLVAILEKELGFSVLKTESPQIIAALGAAIIARENAEKGK